MKTFVEDDRAEITRQLDRDEAYERKISLEEARATRQKIQSR